MFRESFWHHATLDFTAGALGGLANRLFLWLLGAIGGAAAIKLPLSPDMVNLAKPWLYNGIVWGGIWGFIFLLPWRPAWWLRGLVLGVGPSLVVWLYILPVMAHAGLFGLGVGPVLTIIVLVANWVWGLLAAWWLDRVEPRPATA